MRTWPWAASLLVDCGGGEVAVEDGKVLGQVKLPILGLMSPKSVEEVAAEVRGADAAWATDGLHDALAVHDHGASLACLHP